MSEVLDEWEPEERGSESYLPSVMDAELFPDDVAAWACSVTPGSAVVKVLAMLDPARMSHAGRVDAVAAWDRQTAWSQARQDRFLAAMAEDPTVPTPAGELDKDWTREEVACALRLSFDHAATRLQVATELTGRLPGTLDLQERGEITSHHSRSLAEATMALDQLTASKVEEAVLAKAPDQALASFRRSLKRNLLKHAPQTAEQAHAKGLAERRVVRVPSQAGMSGIWMLLPDAGATVVMTPSTPCLGGSAPMTPGPRISAAPMPRSKWPSTPCTAPPRANCRASTACVPRSRSLSPCPRCWAWTSSPANYPAADRSPPL